MSDERIILLVDDVPQLGTIASEFLQRSLPDVRVVTHTSPEKALAWLEGASRVDLVLSDNRMDGLDGLTLLGHARELHPDALLALMTAYLDLDVTPAELGARGVHALIRKPWAWPDFARFVAELLGLPLQARKRTVEEGPRPFPETAFREFAAHRAGETARSPGAEAPAGDAEDDASSSGRGNADDGEAEAHTPLPWGPTGEAGAAASRTLVPSGPAATTDAQGLLHCPCCDATFEVHLRLATPEADAAEADDEAEAERLRAYLARRPGVARRLRAKGAERYG